MEDSKSMDINEDKRVEIARSIISLRKHERGPYYYNTHRGMREYLEALRGLTLFFKYIKELENEKKIVLDIGAGSTLATAQLSESDIAKGIDFEATVLTRKPIIENTVHTLDSDKVHITSVETLRGIKSDHYSGIIAVFSIAYSLNPFLAASNMDRILKPGGIIKGSFYPEMFTGDMELQTGLRKSRPFEEAFKGLNYDLAVNRNYKGDVLLAIKPGGKNTMTASDLIKEEPTHRYAPA